MTHRGSDQGTENMLDLFTASFSTIHCHHFTAATLKGDELTKKKEKKNQDSSSLIRYLCARNTQTDMKTHTHT